MVVSAQVETHFQFIAHEIHKLRNSTKKIVGSHERFKAWMSRYDSCFNVRIFVYILLLGNIAYDSRRCKR